MALDIEVPNPPALSNRGKPRNFEWTDETLGSEDFRREELEALLQQGAWTEGVTEWAEYTHLDHAHVDVIRTLGLFHAFDFYWDPTKDRLRYDAPTMPEDWRERDATASLDSGTVSLIDNELDALGGVVQEVLEDYLEREDGAPDFGWGEDNSDEE